MKRILFQKAMSISIGSSGSFVSGQTFNSTFSEYGCVIKKMSCGFIITNSDPEIVSYNYSAGCLVSAGNSKINDMPIRQDLTGSTQTEIYFTDKFENNIEHVIPGGTEFEIEVSVFGSAQVSDVSSIDGTAFVWFEYEEIVGRNSFGR